MTDCKTINPFLYENWDELLHDFNDSTFFHTVSWARCLSDSYRYIPFYFSLFENNALSATVPVMEVRSILGKKRGVSLPFSDFCQPLFSSKKAFETVFECAVATGRKKGWQSITIRGNAPFPQHTTVADYYYRHILPLNKNDDALYKTFRNSTQRNIRKAEKYNIRITFESSREAVAEFYRLNCRSRRYHGLPPQPRIFFDHLFSSIIQKGHGEVGLAYHDGTVISASVFLQSGSNVSYKYGASDERMNHLSAGYLLMWEAIRRYNAGSIQTFCFGRTEKSHTGLLQFKNGWGTKLLTINNYTYRLDKDTFIHSPLKTTGVHNTIFRLMPLPLLKTFGTLLYRYMG